MPEIPIPKTMQAVVYRGPNLLRLEQVPTPRIRANELLVRVDACGVCPTDIKKILHGTVAPPRIFGHETAGTIVRTGAMVRGFIPGDRVALHHHVPCMSCRSCLHKAFAQCATYKKTGVTAGFEPAGGGYAQYVRVLPFCLPGVVKVPKRNTTLEAAFLEPVNTVLKAIHRLSLLPDDRVLVVGQGPIGLLFTRLLSLRNVRVAASDMLAERLRYARQFGAAKAFDASSTNVAEQVLKWSRGEGLDAVVLTIPNDTAVHLAQDVVRGGGNILLFAHTLRNRPSPVDLSSVCVDEKTLTGSYSSDFTLQKSVARLVFSRKLDVRPLVTHTFPLALTSKAIDMAAHPQPDALKIVVTPSA